MSDKFDSSNKKAQIEREKVLYLYSVALERGDAETVLNILQQAQSDPLLKKELDEITDYFYAEAMEEIKAGEDKLVKDLAFQHIQQAEEPVELPPLTLGDVLARLQAEAATGGPLRLEINQLLAQVSSEASSLPLPNNLGQAAIKFLFRQAQLSPSDRLLKLFREKAGFLAMGREQGMEQLAAARRQAKARNTRPHGQEHS